MDRREGTGREFPELKTFRDMTERLPVGIFVWSSGRLGYVNPWLAEMHGFAVDEIAGKMKTEDLVHPDDMLRLRHHIADQLSGRTLPQKVRFRGISKNGDVFFVENNHFYYGTFDGKPAIVGISTDVSECTNTVKQLKTRRDFLETLAKDQDSRLSAIAERCERAEKALKGKSRSLVEVKNALKVMLGQREDDHRDLGDMISSSMEQLVLPYMRMLKETRLDAHQKFLADSIEASMRKVLSPFARRINGFGLTRREMEVVALIKEGRTTKQMAGALNVSVDAIARHRFHIRKKLGLNKRGTNLYSYLLSLVR
ncbi:MAG: PAS domain S-box protein [Syntrophorhabdales bacterium]|jgi:PAS domain S-box-containing protein